MIFSGMNLEPIQSDGIALDDIVCINGVTGWLDFVGNTYIVVVTEKKIYHKIEIKDIRSIVKYSTFIKGNYCSISIKELLAA